MIYMTEMDTESDEFKKGQELLKKCGAEVSVIDYPSGKRGLVISIDENQYHKVMNRNAGRQPSYVSVDGHYKEISVSEVRSSMKTYGIDQTAESLGISRRTLYRKIKKAEQENDPYIY